MTDLFADFVPFEWIDRVFAVMALAPWHIFQVMTKRSARMRAYCAARRLHEIRREMAALEGRQHVDEERRIEWPLPNIWLGVSCENQTYADARIPNLLSTPAIARFVSAEPLLSGIEFTAIACPYGCRPPDYCNLCCPDGRRAKGTFDSLQTGKISQIIVGGESGPGARPMYPGWARRIRDQCATADVPFFFKQWGGWVPTKGATVVVWPDGSIGPGSESEKGGGWEISRAGRFGAGRLLDGIEHNGMPERR